MRKPDFFIVGAPKCGTTAMYNYLRQHPEIFMPSIIKEPCFFGADLHHTDHANRTIHTLEQYLSLFAEVIDEKRVGEASTAYFYSKCAAKEIKKFNPSARIIIMLRNPIDTMYSLHSQQLYQGNEDIVNFEGALDAEEKRKQGLCLPKYIQMHEVLFYREIARYTPHIYRYINVFGRDNIQIIIFDDFKKNTAKLYRDTLFFLNVSPDFQPDFHIFNPNKRLHMEAFHRYVLNPPYFFHRIISSVVPLSIRQELFTILRRLNTSCAPRPPMNPELRRGLQAEFLPEVEQLSKLLGRDLTYWCKEE